MQDVALLAVLVFHECDARGAIRIILDLTYSRGDAELIALEIDDPLHALVPTANKAHRDVAMIVAAAALGERLHQRLLTVVPRDLREIGDRAGAGARSYRLELTNSHSAYA